MTRKPPCRSSLSRIVLFASLALAPAASAVDGVVEINQARALAGLGGLDTPGFPVTLSAAGSYRLTGNLKPTASATDLISVTASSVRIDLNGFALQGDTSCVKAGAPTYVTCTISGASARGVAVDSSLGDVHVMNGTIEGMTGNAIDAEGSKVVVTDVRMLSNGGSGLVAAQAEVTRATANLHMFAGLALTVGASRVRDTIANNNGDAGIRAFGVASLENVEASENGAIGLQVGAGSTILNARSTLNGAPAISFRPPTRSHRSSWRHRLLPERARSTSASSNTCRPLPRIPEPGSGSRLSSSTRPAR